MYGGTGIFVTDELSHKVLSTGRDPTGLGRWSWIRLKGNNCIIRVVTAYRPCSSSGPETVYSQHKCYYSQRNPNIEPCSQILHDLSTHLNTWTDNGEVIIPSMDANDDIRKDPILSFINNAGLIDPILSQHPNPPSYMRQEHPATTY